MVIIRAVCKAVMRLTWPRSACGSFRLNACELDYLGPLRSFMGGQFAVVRGRPWQRRASQLGNPQLHFGIGKGRIDLHVELVDDLDGRALGHAHATHCARLVARYRSEEHTAELQSLR